MPLEDDILNAHAAGFGSAIKETNFTIGDQRYQLLNTVGEEKATRREWKHHFEQAHALLFVFDITGYDRMCQYTTGIGKSKALEDDLSLFRILVNSRFFATSRVIQQRHEYLPLLRT
jgi:hypothetical protein